MTAYSYSDNVYLKNGHAYKNVTIIDTLGQYVLIQFGNLNQSIPISDIETVLKLPLIPGTKPIFMEETHYKPETSTYYPNMKFLPMVFLASAVAWNSLATASDTQNSIDAINSTKAPNTQIDNSQLERTKSRNEIVGYVSIVAACATLVLCFSDAQIEVSQNQITMRVSLK